MQDQYRLEKEQRDKLAALRAAVALGIGQLDRGEGFDSEEVFAELLDEELRR